MKSEKEVAMVDVVEETLNVDREERCGVPSVQSGFDVMGKRESGVNAGSSHRASELLWG